jgi:hypothetical protein
VGSSKKNTPHRGKILTIRNKAGGTPNGKG